MWYYYHTSFLIVEESEFVTVTTDSTHLLYEAARKLAQSKETPFIVMDRSLMQHKYEQLYHSLDGAEIFYALKANPHWRVASLFHKLGAGFEISSEGELALLRRLQVLPRKIISSNPVKSPSFIQAAHAWGIEYFVLDSSAEVEKLSQLAPGSKVCLRLSVSNEGSQWPLTQKFGVEIEEGISLLEQAAIVGLQPYGITFHVGSQCVSPATWVEAVKKSRIVWDLVTRKGIELRRINIGGGFPIRYTQPVPSLEGIAREVREAVKENFPSGVEIVAEPGRYLVGEAGILVASVIAKARRNGQAWLYLDVGIFNGLMESLGNIKFPMVAARDSSSIAWTLAGPSCDSFDVISKEELPELEIGDKVYIFSAGAYTTAYASHFNGFPIPRTYFT